MLSAIVITRNEEDNIQRCLTGLSFADEIIVIDSGSVDKTVAFARQAGAKVFSRPWPGYGPQKNFGAAQAKGDWLLFVDADEVISPELAENIIQLTKNTRSNTGHDFYWLRIVTVFLNKPLRHLYGHNPRLFKKDAGHWTNSRVHEQVVTNDDHTIKLGDDQSDLIPTPLLHYSHQTITSYIKKMHHYTTLDAQEMYKNNRHRSGKRVNASPLLPWRLSGKQLIKLLFYKRGFLDGLPGITWCFLSAYYEFEMAMKYLRLKTV